MSKVTQGCAGLFSKAARVASDQTSSLAPGIALPHVTLPTTEASGPLGVGGRTLEEALQPFGGGAASAAAATPSERTRRPGCCQTAMIAALHFPHSIQSKHLSCLGLLPLQGGRVEVGAPTGRWSMVVVYRGKHDPLCLTYLAALQQLMPEFEELSCDVVAVSADTRGKACSFVRRQPPLPPAGGGVAAAPFPPDGSAVALLPTFRACHSQP